MSAIAEGGLPGSVLTTSTAFAGDLSGTSGATAISTALIPGKIVLVATAASITGNSVSNMQTGSLCLASDTFMLYRYNGASWVATGIQLAGDIGGTAAAPTVTGGTHFTTAITTSGLTGATAASRYVGATASGAPASGTFLVGDFVLDQTATVWVCTVAGTPGTWAKVQPGLHASTHGPGQADDISAGYGHELSTRAENMTRFVPTSTLAALTSGTTYCYYFTARNTFVPTKINFYLQTVAGTVTSITLAVYAASNAGVLSGPALYGPTDLSGTNNMTSGATAMVTYSGLTISQLVAGTRYALCINVVATTGPAFKGNAGAAGFTSTLLPVLVLTSASSLATINGALPFTPATSNGNVAYVALST